MRQIKYLLIDNCGKNREHHYTVNSKGFVIENTDIRKAVKVIDRKVDPDGYNASSIVILCKSFKDASYREGLKDLIVELRCHYPEAKILGIKEIGDYIIRVTEEMNHLRSELSQLP
jgi:hypothetical protein